MGSDFLDDIDCGNFFDQIDDLIDFPPDNEGGGELVPCDDSKDFPSMWNNILPEYNPLLSGSHTPDLSTELSVPCEDVAELEWLSTFVEDSFSGGGMTLGKETLCYNNELSNNQLQTFSPVSVLESSSSSSSCSGGKTMPFSPSHRSPQRARSKRPRPATFNPRAAISSFIDTPQPFTAARLSSESENFAKSQKMIAELDGPEQRKKKKIKKTLPVPDPDEKPPVRKCMHCEITMTPQWRTGPNGPKTLCNACGVRHKSGRLFPEYRPAASPTYVAALHSNSHKKVLEMRNKVGPETTSTP